MVIYQIQKRSGEIKDFDLSRIQNAIQKAVLSMPVEEKIYEDFPEDFASNIAKLVESDLEEMFFEQDKVPCVENIQDLVEKHIAEAGYFEVAKRYILYRAEHQKFRSVKREKELETIEKKSFYLHKRGGRKELFDIQKLKRVFSYVSHDMNGNCTFEDLYEVFKLSLVEGMETQDILKSLRRAALDLVTVENIEWQVIAARLYLIDIYKSATKNRNIDFSEIYSAQSFKKHFDDYIELGLYYKKFYDYYSEEEILEAGEYIDAQRDYSYVYSTVLAFDKRYLLNPNKVIRELPQEMYMAIALFLAIPERKEDRLAFAKKVYDVTSLQELSLPTPTLLNARTNFHQLSSCFKLNVDDDLRSIYHNIENMAQISKYGGGVGVYMGHIRSKGAEIRGVEKASGGVIPWTRVINDTACAVNQLGSRMGAISPTLDVWHRDIYDFLHLQTETGDIRSKAFDIFPAVSVPDLFMKRVEMDQEWTLFDPYEVKKRTGKRLEDAFGEEFESFYMECERNNNITLKERVRAKDLMKEILKTTVETGMPYVFYRDTVNRLNPNKHVGNIYSTQLCTEICQNTSEASFTEESYENGKVSIQYNPGDAVVCNLASINVAKVNTKEDIETVISVAMRVLDNVITLNFYPIKESEITAKKYRSVGLGFMGLAEYLACNKMRYDSKEAREKVDELFENYAFQVLKESHFLAQERGAYPLFEGSDWQKGKFFGRDKIWYDSHAKRDDWRSLMAGVEKDGLRFAYHLAPAPNTSTSGVVGTTAGLLPIYKKFFIETNALAPTVTVAPNLSQENFWYYKEYMNMDMHDVIDMIAVIYKWVDQSISFEWMIDPTAISPAELYSYYVSAWKKQIKTVYYLRSLSAEVKETCESCSG